MPSVTNIILLIVAVYVLIYILYSLYNYFTVRYIITSPRDIHTDASGNNSTRTKIPYNLIKSASSTRYYISSWIFVDNISVANRNLALINRDTKFVLYLNGRNLYLAGDACKNNIKIDEKGIVTINDNIPSDKHMHVTDNFLFQKWVNLIVSVDGNTVDVYLDGKLTKSNRMNMPPPSVTDDILIGSSMVNGKITRMLQYPKPINPQQAWYIYINGSGVSGTGMSKYNIDMELLNDGVIQKTFNLY